MLKHLADFVCGWRTLTVPQSECGWMFDLLYRNTVPFTDERRNPDGTVTIRLRGTAGAHLRSCLADSACTLSDIHGLPVVCTFLLRRPALIFGTLLAAVWLFYSTRIIWDVRIEGAEKTDPEEITALLAELGCGVGDYIPAIDFNDLHAAYAAVQQDIAWLSVYMKGTVAEVQVRELWRDERPVLPEAVYADVIADADGIVEEVSVFEGQACVRPGDLVRKGQILISGVITQKDGSCRYEYASGEVICRTAQPISVKIQTEREVKSYTGRESVKKRIKFFKKTINLFGNSGTLDTNYDKIYTIEQVCPLGLCKLPVWYETTVYREYKILQQTISADEAADEAMAHLAEQIRAVSRTSELVSKSVDTGFADDVYRIDCLMYLRRGIGQTAEYPVPDSCVPGTGITP